MPADPGRGAELAGKAAGEGGPMEFLSDIIPTTLFSSLTSGNVLQALFVALLVGFAIQAMAHSGRAAAARHRAAAEAGVPDPGR